MLLHFIFWSATISIIYTFAGYPFVLKILSIFLNKRFIKSNITPTITLLVSCYNEESVLDAKLANTLEIDYPKDRLEVIVVSDGSSDNTDRIAQRYAENGFQLRRFEGRIGKTACINRVLPDANGDIILFSDANALYDKSSLINIARNFSDDSVGCVTGFTKYIAMQNGNKIEAIGLYSRIERITKILESSIGSCIGADGALFAIRKEFYEPLQDFDINDFVIPLKIVSKGYRVVFDKDVFCIEESAQNLHGEFKRQVRITNRTIRALWNNKHLLNIMRYPIFSFQLISHKLFKFLTPLFLVMIAFSSFILSFNHTFYALVLILQIIIYGLILFPEKSISNFRLRKLRALCRIFLIMNIAAAKGWLTFFMGKNFVTWKSSR